MVFIFIIMKCEQGGLVDIEDMELVFVSFGKVMDLSDLNI